MYVFVCIYGASEIEMNGARRRRSPEKRSTEERPERKSYGGRRWSFGNRRGQLGRLTNTVS